MASGKVNVNMALLWENTTPTNAFGSQTVSLDLTAYAFCMVVFQHWSNDTTSRTYLICKNSARNVCEAPNEAKTAVPNRVVSADNSGVWFGGGVLNGNLDNSAAIPLFIYGIK